MASSVQLSVHRPKAPYHLNGITTPSCFLASVRFNDRDRRAYAQLAMHRPPHGSGRLTQRTTKSLERFVVRIRKAAENKAPASVASLLPYPKITPPGYKTAQSCQSHVRSLLRHRTSRTATPTRAERVARLAPVRSPSMSPRTVKSCSRHVRGIRATRTTRTESRAEKIESLTPPPAAANKQITIGSPATGIMSPRTARSLRHHVRAVRTIRERKPFSRAEKIASLTPHPAGGTAAANETALSPRTRRSIERYCTARRTQVLSKNTDTTRKALAF